MNEDFEKWFVDDGPEFFSFGEHFDGNTVPYASFGILLQLESKKLKPFTKDALKYLESDLDPLEWTGLMS